MLWNRSSIRNNRRAFNRNSPAASRIARRAGAATGALVEGLEQRALLSVDLVYHQINTASNALPGGMITVNSSIENTGDQAVTTPFLVKFYLSDDNVLDGGDVEVGSFANNIDVPAAGERGFSIQFTVPNNTPQGNRFVIGVADANGAVTETNENNNTLATQFFVGNMPPVVASPIVGPFTMMTRSSTLTILELDAHDDDNITGTLDVSFWYDMDSDGVLSESADRLIGAGTPGPSNSFVYSGPVPTFFRAGTGRVFAKAFDGLDSTVSSATFTLDASNAPVVQGITSTPAGVLTWGDNVTFNATGVSAPDDMGSVANVKLYRETNGTTGFQNDDELIGTMSRDGMTDRWTLTTTVDSGWGTAGTFYAQATDTSDRTSNVAEQAFTFASSADVTLGSLTGPGGSALRGRPITLTANNASPSIQTVNFYRDSNGDGVLQTDSDQLLGTSNVDSGAATFDATIDPAWGAGSQTFFAVGLTAGAQESAPVSLVQALRRNTAPRVTSLQADKTTVSKGQQLTLTAQGVTDNDGPERVEFFRDSNRNGRFDANDVSLGTGTRSGSNWRLTLTVPTSFINGTNRFFVKAYDVVNAASATRTLDLRVTKNVRPTIATFTANPTNRLGGQVVNLLARGVTDNGAIGSVQMFFDSNGNGRFDRATDLLLGNANRLNRTSNYRLRYTIPADLAAGHHKFFAVAFDNLGLRSAAKVVDVNVTTL